MYTLTQTQQTIHKDLLWSTGMLLNTGRSYMGKEPQKEYMYTYMYIYIYICGLVSQSWSLSRLGSSWGSWGGWASKGAPLDAECLVPCGWDPDLQIQVGPPPDEPSLPHAKEGELSGLEEL